MTQTLHREAIQKVKGVLIRNAVFCSDGLELEEPYKTQYQNLAQEIVDAVLELRAFKKTDEEQPKYNTSNWGVDWAVALGEEAKGLSEEEGKSIEAKEAFERDMKFNPLPWGSTRAWEKLEKFVVKEYQKDAHIFFKYKSCQQGDWMFDAMKNNRIRSNPEEFVDNFPGFLHHLESHDIKEDKPEQKSSDGQIYL